jgi:pyrroline-5-carboxylate reductase
MTAAAAAAFLFARTLGLDDEQTMTALTVIIGVAPAAITWLVEAFTGGPAETDGEISPALEPVLDELAVTAASALEKARKGQNWKEEVAALEAVSAALSQAEAEHP